MIRHTLAILAAFILALPLHAKPESISGKCVAVHDGDTITLVTEAKQEIKVRLAGIDAPEAKQPFGTKAKQALSNYVFGRAVIVHATGTDRYRRTLGRIEADGKDINLAMVQEGMAWHFAKYAPKDAALAKAQAEARAAKRGLWVDPAPVPPWDFRAAR